jgi:peptidoglycan/xylan/chitin deacetylase (PgdA/CDA1 family)
MVALTFDDGPEPIWTERVLAALRERGAAATFFVDGRRALTHPELIAATVADGHEVGFHCMDHVRHSELSEVELEADVAAGLYALASLGIEPRAWRTPWGVVTDATRRVAAGHRLELCGWSFDSHDWRGDTRGEMLAALDRAGGLAAGEVVLMHDGIGPGARRSGCAETARLTGALLDRAAGAGLRPLSVSELSATRAGR